MTNFCADDLLLPYQQAWLSESSQIAAIEKSRRVGVSWSQAGSDALHCSAVNGGSAWYMGQDKDMSQAYIEDAAWWAREVYQLPCSDVEEDIFNDGEKDILRHKIRYKSGHTQTSLSSRPANLRSKGRPNEIFTFDECAFHPDFAGLLKAAGALMMWGCRMRFISSHNGEDNPWNEFIKEMKAGKRPGVVHRITFRNAVAQGVYKRICQILGQVWTQESENEWVQEVYDFYGENAAEELDVIPSAGSGVFLTTMLIRQNMVPAERVQSTWHPVAA